MYVGLRMKRDVVTVTPQALLTDAHNLMEENRLWMLPVVDDAKLVGYLQKEDVRAALPSPATLLSRHELPTVLSKVTIEDLIQRDVITVAPETDIETAAEIVANEGIPGLAVVDDENRLLGYINRSIMLEVLVEEMGLHRGGKRFAIAFIDRPGVMAEVAKIISDMEMNLVSAASFYREDTCILVFRVQTEDLTPILDALQSRGYHVVGPDYFAREWRRPN